MPSSRSKGEARYVSCFALFLLAFALAGMPGIAGYGQDEVLSAANERPIMPALRHLDCYFPFSPPQDRAAWLNWRERARHDLLVSLGLDPLPTRHPLNAVRHSRTDCGDYEMERVYFESWPGFYVTGNLYLPKNVESPAPAVLCPHGHWRHGRFLWASDDEIQREIDSGAETFVTNARSVLQSRCVHLARMGCVVFHYDMLGYADSQQIPYAVAHGFAKRRPEMEGDGWGLFSPRAELESISVMGLQTWNSIRALDFVESLPEVDPQRIAVTGASGGGTQTFILCAIDDRPSAAFPAVMVSTAMQGGCTCENCCGLRISAGNIDFAALFAPKPLGLTAANDWTREMETKGYPELRALYEMLGVPENLFFLSRLEFGHNYNQISREAMYAWFHRHLGLPGAPIRESPIDVRTAEFLTVFGDGHPIPRGGPSFERELVHGIADDAKRQLGVHQDSSPEVFDENAERIARGWSSLVRLPTMELRYAAGERREIDGGLLEMGKLEYVSECRPLPITRWLGSAPRNGSTLLIVSSRGVNTLVDQNGKWDDDYRRLVNQFDAVYLVDLAFCGALADEARPRGENQLVQNGREAAGYTFGYNRTVMAWRAAQLCAALQWIATQAERHRPARITMVAPDGFGPEALLAATVFERPEFIQRLVVNLEAFRFDAVSEFTDARFLPGAARYGDVDACVALVLRRGLRLLVGTTSKSYAHQIARLIRSEWIAQLDRHIAEHGALTAETIVRWLRRD